MPNGIGKGDGDPGSHSSHFGYLESYDIPGHIGSPLYKAFRRTGPTGCSLPIGNPCDFQLTRYYCIEMPNYVKPGNRFNDPPWIHIAHLEGESATPNSEADFNSKLNDPDEVYDNGSSNEETIVMLKKIIAELENAS